MQEFTMSFLTLLEELWSAGGSLTDTHAVEPLTERLSGVHLSAAGNAEKWSVLAIEARRKRTFDSPRRVAAPAAPRGGGASHLVEAIVHFPVDCSCSSTDL